MWTTADIKVGDMVTVPLEYRKNANNYLEINHINFPIKVNKITECDSYDRTCGACPGLINEICYGYGNENGACILQLCNPPEWNEDKN